jgi:hypothetical protein
LTSNSVSPVLVSRRSRRPEYVTSTREPSWFSAWTPASCTAPGAKAGASAFDVGATHSTPLPVSPCSNAIVEPSRLTVWHPPHIGVVVCECAMYGSAARAPNSRRSVPVMSADQ